MWFAIHPLLASNSDYFEKEYKTSIVQDDKHYTWVKFEPKEKSGRSTTVAQIGVIKYQNSVSPANFPLQIMWLDPGGCETTWNFTKVSINDESTVQDSDFTIELRRGIREETAGRHNEAMESSCGNESRRRQRKSRPSPRGISIHGRQLFLLLWQFVAQFFRLRFLEEVTMLGPDPAVLFWLPVGIIVIVLVAGYMVYHFAKSNANTSK